MYLTEERKNRLYHVASNRQHDLAVVLENVHDPHNIGAVIRSCDAVGISDVYIVYTESKLQQRGIEVGKKSSSGVRKWINLSYFTSLEECFSLVKRKYERIYGTIVDDSSKDLYSMNFASSCAIVFGNEHDGISHEAKEYLTDTIVIPQFGFVRSLNISVACAVTLFEVMRQRRMAGRYNRVIEEGSADHKYFNALMEKDKSIKMRGKIQSS